MTRLIAAAAVLVLAGVMTLTQSALTGKWQGTTPNGAKLRLDLTATDTAVSGTLTRNDQTVKITDGKVKDKTFTFKATLEDQPDSFSGEVAGDEVRIWLDRRGPDSAITLTRTK